MGERNQRAKNIARQTEIFFFLIGVPMIQFATASEDVKRCRRCKNILCQPGLCSSFAPD